MLTISSRQGKRRRHYRDRVTGRRARFCRLLLRGHKQALSCWVLAAAGAIAQQPPKPAAASFGDGPLPSAEELRKPVQVPRSYAVVIGINEYKDLLVPNLQYAEADARALYSTLIAKESGNFEFENIKQLIGSQATRENIQHALEDWLPSHAQENDRAVVFFVGHGVVTENGRGYIAPYDMDPRQVEKTAYPMDRLGEVFSKRVKARWKVLFLDACHSGEVLIHSTPDRVNKSLRGLPQLFLTMTSSSGSQTSFEDPNLRNGVFTYFLTQGWAGKADLNPPDGVVTASELKSYVEREVQNYSRQHGHEQLPLDSGDFPDDLILGYSPPRREQIRKLAQLSTGSLVIKARPDDVQVEIDGRPRGQINRATPFLSVPGLASGNHTVRGVRMGYEPVSLEVNVVPMAPGVPPQTISVTLLHQRVIAPDARRLRDEGESIWLKSNPTASNLQKAADFFSGALHVDSNYSQAALGLCRVLEAEGKVRDALNACARAVEIDSDFVEARTMTGVLLMDSGKYQEAVRHIQQAATQDPESSYAESLLAEALFLADQPEEAEKEAAKAISLNPVSAQAFLLRGDARRLQGKFDDAIDDYNRALRDEEFESSIGRKIAFWAIGTGMQKSSNGYRFLYNSQKASAFYGLCGAELGRENYLRAVRDCNASLEAEKDDPETLILRAECYKALFNNDTRREYLVRAQNDLKSALRLNAHIDRAPDLQRYLKEIEDALKHLTEDRSH